MVESEGLPKIITEGAMFKTIAAGLNKLKHHLE
jgi:hypothetical protein